MRFFLTALFLCWLAVPCRLSAETASGYVIWGAKFNHRGEYDLAIAAYNQALTVADPNDPNDKQAISYAYNNRGNVWVNKGDPDRAIADYNQALSISPNDALVYSNRGRAWHEKGEYDKAIADYTKALAVDPNYALAYAFRGAEWRSRGEYDKDIADQKQALAIDPNFGWPYAELSSLYATCPDAKYRDARKALESAKKAYQLSDGKRWDGLDTLAVAYAESGDFKDAQKWEEKAIDMAPEEAKQWLRSRLELYKQGKPYHEPPEKK